eukprot:CAMPEP_0181394442 /NCGR_PEP_ID=MMETSP1106-20121128/27783_1 /TAXON_ID=81844 /ORGANISM="Mantoniella antarctica, Strain SL-175" /LENGTH=119 /DNA_ID=CAMNT_0023515945 /DNA_START=214 /DNA_END=569 /DNA_ORIENTATION=+
MAMAASAAKTSKDPEALKRELWGWYMYDFANSAFFQSAGTVFIPLLIDGMATEYAWSRQGNARPKTCADLKDDKLPETECVRCVEGYGSRIITLDSISGLQTHRGTATLRLPGGINPTS